MDFELSQRCHDLQQSLRSFVSETVLPQILKYEQKSVLPRKIFRNMGTLGFLRAHVPIEFGGLGMGTIAYCLFSEEVSRAGAGMTHNGHFQTIKMMTGYGSPAQRDKYLRRLLDGEYLAATAITEPDVGSSFASMKTTVKRRGKAFILNGIKTLINDAAEADIVNVFARGPDGGEISVFLIEKGTPGFKITKKQDPIGMRSSPIYEFELRNCTVGGDQLIGESGMGLKAFFSAFNFSRLGNASASLGIAQAALDRTLTYLKGRQVGNHKASEFQGLRWQMAELDTQLAAARLLRDNAALLEEAGRDISLESARTKLLCVEVATRVVGCCIQSTGRFGCLRDNLFDLYYRDAKVLGTAGGSLEVMKNNIARRLFEGVGT
ncbi:MAG: acyl-CoA dehydrogenase family protein [Deltaproteobacteria bacterium]|nr:acyl-CoA dehydrogenase family protein [Deltaproteobacteria bacterium]